MWFHSSGQELHYCAPYSQYTSFAPILYLNIRRTLYGDESLRYDVRPGGINSRKIAMEEDQMVDVI